MNPLVFEREAPALNAPGSKVTVWHHAPGLAADYVTPLPESWQLMVSHASHSSHSSGVSLNLSGLSKANADRLFDYLTKGWAQP